jgi:hypothetical protein
MQRNNNTQFQEMEGESQVHSHFLIKSTKGAGKPPQENAPIQTQTNIQITNSLSKSPMQPHTSSSALLPKNSTSIYPGDLQVDQGILTQDQQFQPNIPIQPTQNQAQQVLSGQELLNLPSESTSIHHSMLVQDVASICMKYKDSLHVVGVIVRFPASVLSTYTRTQATLQDFKELPTSIKVWGASVELGENVNKIFDVVHGLLNSVKLNEKGETIGTIFSRKSIILASYKANCSERFARNCYNPNTSMLSQIASNHVHLAILLGVTINETVEAEIRLKTAKLLQPNIFKDEVLEFVRIYRTSQLGEIFHDSEMVISGAWNRIEHGTESILEVQAATKFNLCRILKDSSLNFLNNLIDNLEASIKVGCAYCKAPEDIDAKEEFSFKG